MSILYRLFNLNRGMFRDGTTYRVSFTEMWAYPVTAVLIAFALVALVLVLYRYESRRASRRVRLFVAAVRVPVLLGLLGAVLSPAFVFKSETRDKSHVIILIDQSSSMLLPDNYSLPDGEAVASALRAATGEAVAAAQVARTPRIDIANRIATFLRDKIDARRDLRVAVYSFAEQLRAVEEGNEQAARAPIRLAAGGDRTEIGTALAELLRTFRGQDVSAVVIISDGCNNAGQLPGSAGDIAKERRLPVYVLGIGNPRHPKDIQVANFLVNDTLLVNDPADLEVDVSAWGYEGPDGSGEEAEVLLEEQASDGTFRTIDKKTIRLLPQGKRVRVHFEHTPKEVGEKVYSMEVRPRGDETRADNNSESVAVSVVDAQLRVLYVTDEPTWEYRTLSRTLIQDKAIHVACYLQSADPQFEQDGDESIEKLPESLEQFVRHEKKPTGGTGAADARKKEYAGYDVVVLAGVNPAELKESFVTSLATFVRDHGGGLLFAAGKKMTPYMLKNTRAEELLTLLPVEIDETRDTSNYGKRLFADEFHSRLTAEGAELRLAQLGRSPDETRRLWESTLPGFYWYYPVRRAKPGATVIAVHERDLDLASALRKEKKDQRLMPVIAAHFYGKGRVMFVGVDETWRWRKNVGDRHFYKFWSQSLHYLGKGSLLKKLGGVTIATDKSAYTVGETATIRANVTDEATLEPSKDSSQVALIQEVGAAARPEELTLSRTEEKGAYEATWKARERGTYHVWLRVRGKKEDERPGLRKFEVQLPAREKEDLRLDEKVLASLATQEGRFYRPAELARMAEIPDLVKPVGEARVTYRTETVWDSPGLLIVLVALLAVEWVVRRGKGLA